MRVGRRGLLIILASSAVGAAALLVTATAHKAEAFRTSLGLHWGVEVLLWAGATLAVLALAWGLQRFRQEVGVEKQRRERKEVREEYLREVRDYELARSGPGGRWNN